MTELSIRGLFAPVAIAIALASGYWQCGFHHNSVYVRGSTKSTERKEAIKIAERWFYRKQAEFDSGATVTSKRDTFGYHADLAIKDYERLEQSGKASKTYVHGIKVLIENHIKPFFGRYARWLNPETSNINVGVHKKSGVPNDPDFTTEGDA